MVSPARILYLLCACLAWGLSAPVVGAQPQDIQTLTLGQKRAKALIARAETAGVRLILSNGFYTTSRAGRLPVMAENADLPPVSGRHIIHYSYSLLAAKLADQGLVDLDAPLYPLFPGYDLGEYFAVPVTLRLLMSQTTGFSVPRWYAHPTQKAIKDRPLGDSLRTIRTASTRLQDDPLATVLLVKALEILTEKDITSLIEGHLLAPMGLSAHDFTFVSALSAQLSARTALVLGSALGGKILDQNNRPFLSQKALSDFRQQLVTAHHPMGKSRSAGMTSFPLNGQMVVTPSLYCSPRAQENAALFALDGYSAVALLVHSPAPSDQSPGAPRCLAELGRDLMGQVITSELAGVADNPRAIERAAIAEKMSEGDDIPSGIYLSDTTPSHWMSDRLDRITSDSFSVKPLLKQTGRDALLLTKLGSDTPIIYNKINAYHYESNAGSRLLLSRTGGGYGDLDGRPYRFTGFMGSKFLLVDLYPFALLMCFSALIYCRSKISKSWRRMAYIVSTGSLLLAGGIYLEDQYGIDFYQRGGLDWVMLIWRIALNAGLMGLITMPFFAMQFSKSGQMTHPPLQLMAVNIHLTLLSASAISLFLWAMIVNASGNFLP